jgi:RHS repeat-associated core domain
MLKNIHTIKPRKQPERRIITTLLCLLLLPAATLFSQTDITLQDVVMGKMDVVTTHSVSLKPGFHAMSGSNFHAGTGPTSNVIPYSSATISTVVSDTVKTKPLKGNNYIRSITFREAKTDTTGTFRHLESIQYFDGLGRPIQTIQVGASPSGNDIILPVMYDDFGRETIKPLPYFDNKNDGSFRSEITMRDLSKVNTCYLTLLNDTPAYTRIGYDNSPLNRVVSQIGPGKDWVTNSKSIQTNYLTNDATDTVNGWNVNSDGSFTPFNFAANMLYVTETIDEQGNATREYKDMQGRVVQKKSKLGNTWLRTAYVYDDLGLLRCVVSPQATNPNTDQALCYYYTYDNRSRMAVKKIPGGGTVLMVYDKRDRLRFTKSSLQDSIGEWSYIKYDTWDRPVINGTITSSMTPSKLDSTVNDETTYNLNESIDTTKTTGYSNASYPTMGTNVYTITYYDRYYFNLGGTALSDSLKSSKYDNGTNAINISGKLATSNKGRVTQTMTMVLSSAADPTAVPRNKLFATTWYDKYGHILRTISENHLSGKDVMTSAYEDITYQVTKTHQEHFKSSEHITLDHYMKYDHTGRLLATYEAVNNQTPITLNMMKYNEIGEMITKYLHATDTTSTNRSFEQKVDYQYNIRGWLTQINDPTLGSDNDLFGMQLCYTNVSALGNLAPSSGLYNGNIAGMKWNIKGDAALRGYQFSYDALNRMLQANYAEGATLNTKAGYNNEIITSYDKNGNILGLKRTHNNNLVDNLMYSYTNGTITTNQLQSITDTGISDGQVNDYVGPKGTYKYDKNGNMIFDGSRHLTLDYHPTLNLQRMLQFGQNNNIFYTYEATGAKLIKHVTTPGGDTYTHYIGNIVYNGGTLSYIITGEGRLVPMGTGVNRKFLYEYSLKDHLGNNRVTFMGTNMGGPIDVVQTTNYYPFGLVMNQTNGTTDPSYPKNKYLYNGKELQDDYLNGTFFGLEFYGARFYDPQIGRWHSIDPRAELYFNWNPYNYVLNTPTNAVDPSGKLVIFVNGFTPHANEQGTSAYWRQQKEVHAYYEGCNGNCYQKVEAAFDKEVMAHFNDYNSKYLDGSLGGISGFFHGSASASTREKEGYEKGKEEAAAIIAGLKRSGGVIIESIKVISHSMGGAYAKGYIRAILKYAEDNPELCNGLKISEYDFDPFQAGSLNAKKHVHTEQYTHIGMIADEKQKDLDQDDNKYIEDPNKEDHSIFTFFNNIDNLEEGTYIYIDGQWVKQ